MGLDVTHDCWSGSYSAFNRWRNTLAEVAGYYVEERHLRDYGSSNGASRYEAVPASVALDWGHVTEANLQGDWGRVPHNILGEPDPLLILLAHSDSDGLIRHEHCAMLADRLEQLLPLLPDEGVSGDVHDWRHKATRRFIGGLRQAAATGQDVEFG